MTNSGPSLDRLMHTVSGTRQGSKLGRRCLIAGASTGAAIHATGGLCVAAAKAAEPAEAKQSRIACAAIPEGVPLRSSEFGLVGVFDIDWLLEPRFTRLLDYFAASPGAFTGVRFFGALNSGERENTFPRGSGGVWHQQQETPDFSVTLEALTALVSRRIVPFVTLSFFPSAVSASPVEPPQDLSVWAKLVKAFLHAVVDRFGAPEVGKWRFEVWNEPNFKPFWAGDFDQYLNLYRATSEAVTATGYTVRLGGPTLVYTPDSDGAELMERFLRFLVQEPEMQCDFVSYHRKGAWFLDQDAPWLGGLQAAAEQIAQAVLRLAPGRAAGLELINNEADMKVGFDRPFEPRMNERFAAWQTASLIMHQELDIKYARHGMRFLAVSDDANQQLIQAPFDGRRSVMTRASDQPDDLVKLPVYAFYELLRLLSNRRALVVDASAEILFPSTDLFHLPTVDAYAVAVLLTSYPDRHAPADAGGRGWTIDYSLSNIPWPRINVVCFCVDAARVNPLVAGAGAVLLNDPDAVRRVRAAQELGVVAPLRSDVALPKEKTFKDTIDLLPFATVLLWITPFAPEPPAAPVWLAAQESRGNAILRWTPAHEPGFYSYEIFRMAPDGQPGQRLSPMPLRSALWVDTKPSSGTHIYGVRTVTASGVASPTVTAPPIRI